MRISPGTLTTGLAALLLVGAASSTLATTDTASAAHLDVDAGVIEAWRFAGPPRDPALPVECGDAGDYASILWGTPGDDTLIGGNHPQIVMGVGGNDTLRAGTQGDCLVGGDGDDQLYGDNAKDVLLGGAGNDLLDGGNSPDYLNGGDGDDGLDGGNGPDTCIGGGGDDTIVNCEAGSPAAPDAALADTEDPEPTDQPTPLDPRGATADLAAEETAPGQPSSEPASDSYVDTSEPNDVAGDVADTQPATE